MKARWGSQAEAVTAAGVGGRGGGVCGAGPAATADEPVATLEEFAAAAATNRFWYARIVLRSIPVTRSITRWLAPDASSVPIVVCKCGFKTFTPCVPLV